jgi:hypothetical protein
LPRNLPANLYVGNRKSRHLIDQVAELLPTLSLICCHGLDARCMLQIICLNRGNNNLFVFLENVIFEFKSSYLLDNLHSSTSRRSWRLRLTRFAIVVVAYRSSGRSWRSLWCNR